MADAHDKMHAAEDELASLHARLRAHAADVGAREKVLRERAAAVDARETQLRSLVSSTIQLVLGKFQTLEGEFRRCSTFRENAEASMREARDAAARRGGEDVAAASAAADAAEESRRLEEAWTELFGSFRRAKHELDTQAALIESEAARVMTHVHRMKHDRGQHDDGVEGGGGGGGRASSLYLREPRGEEEGEGARGGGGSTGDDSARGWSKEQNPREDMIEALAISVLGNVEASNDDLEQRLRGLGMTTRG